MSVRRGQLALVPRSFTQSIESTQNAVGSDAASPQVARVGCERCTAHPV
jgi:hypothetical protein